MTALRDRRIPVWLLALLGFVMVFTAAYLSKSGGGAAAGYAFSSGLIGAILATLIGWMHNISLRERHEE